MFVREDKSKNADHLMPYHFDQILCITAHYIYIHMSFIYDFSGEVKPIANGKLIFNFKVQNPHCLAWKL